MKVKIVRKDKTSELPKYQSSGAVAFDLTVNENAILAPLQSKLFGTGLTIGVPSDHALLLIARSGLAKKGLILRNAVGVIDQDYHGPEDEVRLFLYNFTNQAVEVKKGDRLAQGLIVPAVKAEWEEVDVIKADSRGGFGSTGN